MTAFVTRMPAGVAGAISRFGNDTQIEPSIVDSANTPTAFGQPIKLNAGKARVLASGDAGSVCYGWLVRPYPEQSSTNGLGAASPPSSGVVNVMRRGYMSVVLKDGAAVNKGDAVYVVTTAGGGYAIGDVVSAASPAGGGTAVAVPGATFMGAADANGITEIFQKY